MKSMQNFNKLPRLTKEEFLFFKKEDEFYKRISVRWKIPLYKRVARILQKFATANLLGGGYCGIHFRDRSKALSAHLKACEYDPSGKSNYPRFRAEFGLF